jgi:hypothetical protein
MKQGRIRTLEFGSLFLADCKVVAAYRAIAQYPAISPVPRETI